LAKRRADKTFVKLALCHTEFFGIVRSKNTILSDFVKAVKASVYQKTAIVDLAYPKAVKKLKIADFRSRISP
jgi:hypothetical protein